MEKKGDIKGLCQALRHEKKSTREKAALALDRLAWTPEDDANKAWYIASKGDWQELAQLGEPALPALILAMRHPEEAVRLTAGSALERIATSYPDSALPLLCEALSSHLIGFEPKITQARNLTVEILGKMGDSRAVLPLVQSHELLWKAYRSIYNPGEGIKNTYRGYLNLVQQSIKEIGESAITPLMEALNSKDDEFRKMKDRLASMLASLGTPAVDPLIKSLDNEDKYVRSYVIHALGGMDDNRIMNHLVKSLRDKDCRVRTSASAILGGKSWQPPNAEEKAYFLLAEILQSNTPKGHLSKTKQDELLAMGEQAVDPLVHSLGLEGKVFTTLPYKNTIIQVAARNLVSELLVSIGKPAQAALEKALEDPDQTIQEAAQETLKRLK
jgi:HEAT repeat protein